MSARKAFQKLRLELQKIIFERANRIKKDIVIIFAFKYVDLKFIRDF